MTLLVCEGACNPALDAIDATISRAPKRDAEPTGTETLWALQRSLVHTPHEPIGCCQARCLTCGTTRRYGAAFR